MNSAVLLLILLGYLGILFFIAYWAEKKENIKWTNNSYIYSLSLAVYCTAWTYYGSIGVAANSGLRRRLEEMAKEEGWELFLPPLKMCTDNAVMIASAGVDSYMRGNRSDLSLSPDPSWQIW